MKSLIIDTSTERGLIAVCESGEVIFNKPLPFGYNQSMHLLPTLEEATENISLDRVIVCTGPGSYTGIRVGAAAAKSFSYALDIPLYGVFTLKGFVPEDDALFAVLVDARIAGGYFLLGKKCGDKVQYIEEPQVLSLDLIWPQLLDVDIIITPNSKRLRELNPGIADKLIESAPSALQILSQIGDPAINNKLDLLYMRKTQAEMEKERKSN